LKNQLRDPALSEKPILSQPRCPGSNPKTIRRRGCGHGMIGRQPDIHVLIQSPFFCQFAGCGLSPLATALILLITSG